MPQSRYVRLCILFASIIFLSLKFIPLTRKSSTQTCVDILRRLDGRRGVRLSPSFQLELHAVVTDWRDTVDKLRKSLRVSNDLSIYGVSLRDLHRCFDVLVTRSMRCDQAI
jgi:hypothetical protein